MPGQQASPEQLARMRQAAASNQEAKQLFETLTEEPPKDMPPPRSQIPVEERVRGIESEIDRIYEEDEPHGSTGLPGSEEYEGHSL